MRIKRRIRTGNHYDVSRENLQRASTPTSIFLGTIERSLCGFWAGSWMLQMRRRHAAHCRQVYRVSGLNQLSAVLTVNQTVSLCEEMRKSLRRQNKALRRLMKDRAPD
jgi:hypothetical protein